MFCRKCGIDNPDGARYCRRCGEPLTGARTSTGGTTSVPPTSGKMTVEDLPVEYRPIGMWGYFGYSLLFAIPFVGWIIALVFAFGVFYASVLVQETMILFSGNACFLLVLAVLR